MAGCGSCNVIRLPASGGVVVGGSATVTDSIVGGGVVCGGSALVEIRQDPYDGLEAVWPLDEVGSGVEGEYKDRSRHQLHGTGGLQVPERIEGVYCLGAQQFTEGEDGSGSYITLPADDLPTDHEFSVSCWIRCDLQYSPRTFYSRGFEDEAGNQWQFSLGYGWINHVVAAIQVINSDGELVTYEAFSNTTLELERNYHVAATWQPGVGLRCFVNGVAGDLYEVPETATAESTNGGYFGRWNMASYPTGMLQEVRLHPCVRSADWLLAEYHNFCDSSFYSVSTEEAAP